MSYQLYSSLPSSVRYLSIALSFVLNHTGSPTISATSKSNSRQNACIAASRVSDSTRQYDGALFVVMSLCMRRKQNVTSKGLRTVLYNRNSCNMAHMHGVQFQSHSLGNNAYQPTSIMLPHSDCTPCLLWSGYIQRGPSYFNLQCPTCCQRYCLWCGFGCCRRILSFRLRIIEPCGDDWHEFAVYPRVLDP